MKQFKRIYIEITNVCNLSCSFCPPLTREKKFMKVEEFEAIINKIKPYTDYVYFHVKGEPLLHKDLKTFLSICEKNNIHANITTNGTRIYQTKDILYTSSALRQINISLHSFENINEHTLDELDVFLNQIIEVAKHLRDHTKTITALRLWNLDKEKGSQSIRERNEYVLNKLEEAFSLDTPIEEVLGIKEGMKLSERIYLNQDYEFAWPSLAVPYIGDEGYCYGLKTQLAILVDGTVVPCCLDGDGIISLGNIFHNTLDEILSTPRATGMQEGFACRKVVEDLCQRCGYRERF